MTGGLYNPRPVDDVPVNGQLTHGITSNRMFDHEADGDAHAQGGSHIVVLLFAYNSIGQGTYAFGSYPVHALAHVFVNTTHDDGDNLSYMVYLPAGTYTIGLLTKRDVDQGIMDIDIDTVEVASWDLYNAADQNNVWLTDAGNVVAISGLKTIRVRIHGKNGASSNHFARSTALIFWRTS